MEWHHVARASEAYELFARRARGTAVLQMAGRRGETPETSTTTQRLWWEGPERFREESGPGGERHLLVRDGERWWAGSADWGFVSSETEPGSSPQLCSLAHLVDPCPLLSVLRLEPLGEERVAGRAAVTATGIPRQGDDGHGFVLHRMGAGADRVELAVDAKRGVVLRLAALLGGAPFHSFEVTEIAFDERFPPTTFVHAPAPGEAITPWRPLHVALDEAARRAPFTVLVPKRVPQGWRLRVTWVEARERPPMPATAHLLYESEDGAYGVQLREQAAADAGSPEDWPAFERLGDAEVADAGEHAQPRHAVRVERDGTRVELWGDDRDLLLALAAGLRPAPTEPPRLQDAVP